MPPRGSGRTRTYRGKDTVTITAQLTDKDPKVRAKAAGDLAAAANAVAESARVVRDRDARELLRLGERPAEVGRTIGVTRAQMARFKAASTEVPKADVRHDAASVNAALQTLLDLLDTREIAAAAG